MQFVNPFSKTTAPVALDQQAQRDLGNYSTNQLLGLLLASSMADIIGKTIPVTLSLDTAAYAVGDVLAETQEVPGALRNAGGSALLQSVVLVDLDDNANAQIDLVFFRSNVSLGVENAGPTISDGNMGEILGTVVIPSASFIDLGGAKLCTVTGINLPLSAPLGTSVFVGAITRGTPTQTAAGIKLILGVRQD